ncbi:MAG: hypothetical protein DLM52_04160 [Chthoniobacterales bacterium]|nr:MAG: hypothetical protein DLM52_04160 [Chthoniobacterales bacterium]
MEQSRGADADGLPVDATTVDPLSDSSWDKWISSHPDATIFHTSAWARVLVDTYGHQAFYFKLSLQGKALALVPMMEVRSVLTGTRGICLPFSDQCAPLLLNNFAAASVVKKVRQIGRERGWSYFEFRDDSMVPKGAAKSESYWAHTLDMADDSAKVSANFSSSVRRALRKAQRSGVTASIRTDDAAVAQFYRLHARTRRKHGVPPQPRTFFTSIYDHIIKPGLGFIVIAEKCGSAVAAAMFFRFGRHAIYKFGASDDRSQEFRPNNLAIASAIDHLARSSTEVLHFGRTDKSNEGLRRFKLSWGAREQQLFYGKFGISADNWLPAQTRPSTLHTRFFRALPAPVNRLAGALLYPHLD